MPRYMSINGVNLFFSEAALRCIEETGTNIEDDVDALRDGSMSPAELLTHCLDGADEDRYQGWLDYVNELGRAVMAADGRVYEPLTLDDV